jgi:EmrB/QacA subfamily drug resistance transporter
MTWTLTITSGPADSTSIEVDHEIVIGRQDADLDVPDAQVSRRHAVVRPVEHGIVVEDLGSTNGTIVNGERIGGPVTLTSSASIQVGNTELELVLPRLDENVALMEQAPFGPVTARKLRIVSGPDGGREIDVDRELVIGRMEADVTILDPELSRRHATVRPIPTGVEIEDLGTTNGTSVNGELIRGPVALTSDATIRLGETELQLTLERAELAVTRVREVQAEGPPEPPPVELALERTLKVLWGPAAGRTLRLDRDLVIGREDADLTIFDPELSRRHAIIRPIAAGVVVEDLGSTNGTFVNGERIDEPTTLTSSGKLQLGTTEIELLLAMPGGTRIRARPASTFQPTRIGGAFDAYAAVALQEAEAEQVEQEAAELTGERAAVPPRVTGVVRAPISPLSRRLGITQENRRWWTLAAMCLGLGMTSLDLTVINVALPDIGSDLKTGLTGLEWVVNAYTLALAVLMVTGGRLGDLYGRRRCFNIGVVVFLAGSMAAGAAPNETVLIASRAVQGVGAAFVIPATLSVLSSVFPPEERGKAIGIWAGVSGVALALGPVVGGVLTEYISWRAVFYINGPIAVAAIAVALLAAPESRDEESERGIDWPGNVILSASLFALILALIEAPTWGWTAPVTLLLIGGSLIGLVVFVVVQTRVRVPMLDFAALRSPVLVGANFAGFASFFVMLSMLVYIAVYMQSVLGYGALQSGIRFLPGTGLVAFVAPVAGILMSRIVPRYIIAFGLVLVAIASVVVTRVTSTSGYGLLVPAMVLVGVGVGAMMPPMSATAVLAVRRNKAGMASGVLNMSRQVGAAFGVAITGSLFNSLTKSSIKDNLADLPLTAAQKTSIADGALSGGGTAVSPGGKIDPEVAAKIGRAVSDGISSGLAGSMWVCVGVSLVGAVAVLVMAERSKEGAPQAVPVQLH